MAKLSIVVPTMNRQDGIMLLLGELEPLMGECEVVVIDDSTDGTSETIRRRYGDRISLDSHQGARGLSAAINIGFRAARNENVLLLGDDSHLEGDPRTFVSKLLEYLSDKSPLVGLHVVDQHSRTRGRLLARLAWVLAAQTYPETGPTSGYAEFCSLFAVDRKRVPLLFDEGFTGSALYSESDFQLKARRMGVKMYYASDLRVRHDEIRLSTQSVEQQKRTMLVNHRRLVNNNFKVSAPFKNATYRLFFEAIWAWRGLASR